MTPKQIQMSKYPKFRNFVFSDTQLWPHGIVPYKINDWRHKIMKWSIKSALNKLSEKTNGCIRFRKATKTDRNYLNLVYGNGCFSNIGMVGGPQDLSLGYGCEYHPTIQHEFIHALGMFHEHSRRDRDNHIYIKWKNIETKECYNFEKYGKLPPPSLPYEIKSIMHLGSMIFSCKLGKSTMMNHNDEKIGGPLGGYFYPNSLTDLDVKKIKYLYGCK